MAQLKVFWTEIAIKQRNYIFEYWNERNKSAEYSKRLNRKIIERITLLKSQPKLGKQTDFKDIRVISLGHYSTYCEFLFPHFKTCDTKYYGAGSIGCYR